MESLIYENFKFGNLVEVYVKGNLFPIEAKFVKVSRGGILLRSESGKKMVLPVDSVIMIKQAVAPAPKPTVLPHSKENAESPVEVSSEEKIEEPQVEHLDSEEKSEPATDETLEAKDPDLFRLPSENRNELKIVGSIELPESKKKIFNRPEKLISNPHKLPEAKINEEDFEATVIPQMGVIKSVGPVYGYIKTPDGPDVYVNRGEFLYRKDEQSILEPGDPVIYSVGSNWKGLMAKCVHRPGTVGEQLDFIEELADKDPRNARLLARQLTDLFPGNADIAEALSDFPQLTEE